MPKRKADALTGGSRDVNPQWMNIPVIQTAADINTTIQAPLPVQRLAQQNKKSLVMEILKIMWDMPIYQPPSLNLFSLAAFLTTKDPNLTSGAGLITPSFFQLRANGTCLDYINRQIIAGSGTDSNTIIIDDPTFHDLTDDAGHGVLVATDNLFVSLVSVIGSSTPTSVVNNALCKILYRWKEVTLEEYIGIVQSQQ